MGIGWYGLVIGALTVVVSCSGSVGGPAPDQGGGAAWRLVRGGDGASPRPELTGVTWGGGRFVAVALFNSILHSADGQTWREADDRSSLYGLHDVVWDGIRFVAVGSTIGHSTDSSRWQPVSDLGTPNLTAIAWNGTFHVAVGHDGLIMRSSDGDLWMPAADSATSETLNDVTWNGTRFVAVGDHGVIIHSADGDSWEQASRLAVPARLVQPGEDPNRIRYFLSGVAWSGERFVAVGYGGSAHAANVVISRDGDRWERVEVQDDLATETFEAVAWNGRRFVAVSYRGTIMHSPDGDRWTQVPDVVTTATLRDVTWGRDRFVAVGMNGTVVVSP